VTLKSSYTAAAPVAAPKRIPALVANRSGCQWRWPWRRVDGTV